MALKSSVVAAGALLLFVHSAWSADAPLPAPVRDFTTYMPTAKATRIEAAEAPVIDGDLSDPIWQKADPITEFYQTDPNEGQPASERTDVRFLYDANNLYVYVYSYDRTPDRIRGTSMNRDGNFGGDDTVRIYLDPLNTRRNAYQFVMNSLGGRLDQLIQNNSDFIREWNTIWTGRARVVADGWTVEMAIPFQDLSFDPAKPDWVLEITREIRHLNERDRWLVAQIGPALAAKGMLFVGLDVIGGFVTEINVTSPTGIRELDKQFGTDIGALLVQAIERRLQASPRPPRPTRGAS